MSNNVLPLRRAPQMTALERIKHKLRLARMKMVEMPIRQVEQSVVYEGSKARPTTNTLMARLLAKDEI